MDSLNNAATSTTALATPRKGTDLSSKAATAARIPILYVILGVLLVISIVPMYFYSTYVESRNREALVANEQMLENTVTRSLAEDLSQNERSLRMMLANLSAAVQVTSGGDLGEKNIQSPELRALLENFVSSSEEIAYTSLLNPEGKGITAGRIAPDIFLQRELERAFSAARDGRAYNGQALAVGEGKSSRTIFLVSTPVMYGPRFLGMIAAVVDLQFLIRRLQHESSGGLTPYVVDSQGRLVAAATQGFATGQDMKNLEIVRNFVDSGNKGQLIQTKEFTMRDAKGSQAMLGTYYPVTALDWAVVVQKTQREAYSGVYEMQHTARLLALAAVLASILASIIAARRITSPLEVLTQFSRAIARGDFSQRVHIRNRTEIGELAETFNSMSQELEHYVEDLKRAADENRALFMGSIQMLAGAVDEKDPYTRGHSDRVTRYSLLLAHEMDLPTPFVEILQISAQLHDVGKIGIEDHILKKPGALTAEEFEVMKTHTTRGANLLRPVTQLAEMLPGIELHHESLDGRGYPYGLQGDQIPLLARVIAVADTFDALTTTRPYQNAHTPDQALQIVQNLAGKRLDPIVVAALLAVYARGEIKLQRFTIRRPVAAASPATAAAAATAAPVPAAPLTAPAASIASEAAELERTRV
jgi:HD-GYP domain-containing protein (c-di-GMP phosphodiesterase class II)